MKNLLIVIPVYNEQENIESVISEWENLNIDVEFDILIINDGSKDETPIILERLKNKYKNLYIINKENSGHGNAIIDGYKYSVEKKYNFTFQVDGDSQFSSSDFKKIWNYRHKVDLVSGNRENRNDPIIRILLSKIFLRAFLLMLFLKYLKDPNVPFRLINNNFLSEFLKVCEKQNLAPNILMSLYAKKIIFIEVKHYTRKTGEINWKLRKLFVFGVKLIVEIISFWKKI